MARVFLVSLAFVQLGTVPAAALGSIPGDADCDGLVTIGDLSHLQAELADGDGSGTGGIEGGTVFSCTGADANGDAMVTAADVSAIVAFLQGGGRKVIATGPIITFIGIVSADGRQSAPIRSEPVPTYQFPGGVGFRVVLEAIRGPSGAAIGEQLLDFKRDDPSARPLLQVSASRDLGNGSVRVCDQGEGGIPGISPPNFGPDQSIADALNDIG